MIPTHHRLVPRPAPERLSIVIPLLNEEDVIQPLRERLTTVVDELAIPTEIILVNDGSSDRTLDRISCWQESDERVRVIALARNFGHQAAATAGLDHARGDVTVLMDGDLQDPPEIIPSMVEHYSAGYEVVYGRRVSRAGESFFKRWTAGLFYRLMRVFIMPDLPVDVGDFRLMSRSVVDAIGSMPEPHRFLRGMVTWVGFPQTAVDFTRQPRAVGQTKYPLRKMLGFAWVAALSFSSRPLRISFVFAAITVLTAVGVGAYAFFRALLGFYVVRGWASLMVVTCLIGSAILICAGVLGEYIGRIFEQGKGRPLYVVAKSSGNGLPSPPQEAPD